MNERDKSVRSKTMARVRSKNTQLEITVRNFLHSQGFRFRIHVDSLPGKPDMVLRKYNLCIFIHGCFWHQHEGCRFATVPKTNVEYWRQKFVRNRKRDINSKLTLLENGWRVFELWQCGIDNKNSSLEWLPVCIKSDLPTLSWPDYICNDDR
ncbi:very short patch repair endonuclease [Serratia sp. PGPR-27]|uniref:very short patch repair endonuclease n=1 Tax=Serratia sp. PGPR-27 TaxID=2923365 RepID=UPI0024131785|nr:very short patch repair endonuclease [Serratia sp. PGPR-27]